jgi:hypothetical protein
MKTDLTLPLEQLERDLTRNHFIEIQLLFAAETEGLASLIPVPEWPELESRSTPRAKPPLNDFCFVHVDNRRWAWPIEAKVLESATSLYEYLLDVNGKFVAGIAGPLIAEGGMIAYLLTGTSAAFFAELGERLSLTLSHVSEFAARPHRTSIHQRKSFPALRLHHMVMKLDSKE